MIVLVSVSYTDFQENLEVKSHYDVTFYCLTMHVMIWREHFYWHR